MNTLASLANAALLGTQRRPPTWPALDGSIGALLDRIPRDSPERALLQAAGVLGTCHLAGWLPAEAAAAPPPAAEETTEQETRVGLFAAILSDGPLRLQVEALQCLADAGRHLPHHVLPRALECGRRSAALRPSLLGVLGRRGAWLAAQNEDWAYAAGTAGPELPDDDAWVHGSLDQRRLYLSALRGRDAARARELVAAALGEEAARERAAWIGCLATGLTLDDQDLLETALADRSKEVRQAAARLLATLSGSRYVDRMKQYLQPCLKAEKKLLRGQVVTVEAPAAFDPAWKADGLEAARPKGHHLGDRAWWLYQLVRRAPLAWWESQTGMSPVELLAWARKSDWKDALLDGWAEAQAAQRRVEWAEAFLNAPAAVHGPLTVFDLLETLPPSIRERHFLRLLVTASSISAINGVLDGFLRGWPLDAPTITPETAAKVVKFVQHRIPRSVARPDAQTRAILVDLACVLPAAAFDDFANGWDSRQEHFDSWSDAIARVGTVLDQRRQILQLKT